MKSRLCIREDAQPVFSSVCGGRGAQALVSMATRGVAIAPRNSKKDDAVWWAQATRQPPKDKPHGGGGRDESGGCSLCIEVVGEFVGQRPLE